MILGHSPARAVLLDLFGTLVRNATTDERERRWRMLADDLSCDADRLVAAFHATRRDRVRGRWRSLSRMLAAIAAVAGTRAPPAGVRRAGDRLLDLAETDLAASEATVGFLDELRSAGWRLGVVTDCEPEVPTVWPGLVLARKVDAITFSCRTGVTKPAASQYLDCCRQLGVAIGMCVFAGDGGSDELAGAVRAGAAAVHLCRESLNPTNPPGWWPEPFAADLGEFRQILAGYRRLETMERVV